MSQNRRFLENKLKEFTILQFDATRILMQHKNTKQKFIYKQFQLTASSNQFLNHIIKRSQINYPNLIKIDYYLGQSSLKNNPNRIGVFYQYHITDLQNELNKRIKMKQTKMSNHQDLIYNQQELINTFSPIINAVNIIHNLKIYYGLIKSKSIIITQHDQTKLSDQFINYQFPDQNQIFEKAYYPPQYINTKLIDKEFDYWSLGLVILECSTIKSSEYIYSRKQNKVNIEKIEQAILKIQGFYSDEFIVGLKLLLSSNKNMRYYGLDVLINKKIPPITIIQILKPIRKLKNEPAHIILSKIKQSSKQSKSNPNENIYISKYDSSKKISTLKEQKSDKKLILKQNENKCDYKKKIDFVKEKVKNKMNEDLQLKKKQIEKINQIIQNSNSFTNQLVAKKLERQKMPSISKKNAILSFKSSENCATSSNNNQNNSTDDIKESILKTKAKDHSKIASNRSPIKLSSDKIISFQKVRSPIKKK